ncbi:ATP-binding protein [Vibrio hepatarius]|uniref:ATP-binding protein n=1 Tax=Vibrio hepatarius TaxID=171383 RepID=UPI00142D9CBA|nr:ATP-binding protein [Vibrio hepatarius]NIY82615.1 two-component sensor histidine kinase [Vibrio hepatarius]
MKNNVPFSIKRRVTGVVIILTITMVSLTLLFSAMSTKHETQEVYDARLGQTAKLLLLTISSFESQLSQASIQSQFEAWMEKIRQLSDSDDDPTVYGHPYENNIVFQLYKNNALVWSSRKDAGVLSPSPEFSGFGDREVDGREWRIFQLHSTDSEFVLVAEKHAIRQEIINEVVLSAILPQMILFPLFIVILIYFIDKSFRPISELRLAISQRSIEKLDRIYVSNQTLELSPLVDTLNQLLEQLELAWQRERQFTRMAAHEIKTPLTILRLNAENALHSQDREQLEQDLGNLLKGIDRTDRVLHQLLTLAKVDSITNLEKQDVVLNNVLQSTLSDLAQLALRNEQHLSLEGDTCSIQGDEFLLGLLFRNLIDNAIRYSGNGSNIDVRVVASDYWYEVFISDSGPNVSDEAREKLFDSFYRANTEKGDGAGLGMSIARDIAVLHNATVELLPRENHTNTFRIRFKH